MNIFQAMKLAGFSLKDFKNKSKRERQFLLLLIKQNYIFKKYKITWSNGTETIVSTETLKPCYIFSYHREVKKYGKYPVVIERL